MKNKGVVFIFISIIFVIIVCFFSLIKYHHKKIDDNLLNKKWYHYDYSTGYYDSFYIDLNGLSYNQVDFENDYTKCRSYNYNKKNNELVLDCGKKIKILEINNNKIILNIDSKRKVFFDNIDDSLNYEFESFYSKSISEVKKEMARVSDLIKINSSRLVELLKTDDYSKIVFYGNKCTSIDCVLSLFIIEKWINISKNIYYVDIENFNDNDLNYINKINSNLTNDKNYYNGIYPRVIILKNNEIINDYEIKCSGFDCSLFENNNY